jgi:transcriptional regulator with XRE-family HTH domain
MRPRKTKQKQGEQVSNSGVAGFDPARLRTARTRAGLSQRSLAEKLLSADTAAAEQPVHLLARAIETTRTQVHYYETGQRVPRPDMLHRLGTALGVDPLALLDPRTPVTLAVLRARRGLRQADVAEHLTCGRAYYSRIEAGTAPLNSEDRERLAALLNINPADVDRATSTHAAATVGSLLHQMDLYHSKL